jgi:antitoxin HicB
LVPVRPATAAKVAFADAFHASGLTRVELARRLKLDDKEVRRMLDPDHSTKIERLDEAIRALGQRFVLTVEAA